MIKLFDGDKHIYDVELKQEQARLYPVDKKKDTLVFSIDEYKDFKFVNNLMTEDELDAQGSLLWTNIIKKTKSKQ